ncbi:MAG TPA: hypothetical protein VMV29_18505 [Ktedonobacterales bacterium]|nr:hypothetical protein [Ktedonobacterales bacterium]
MRKRVGQVVLLVGLCVCVVACSTHPTTSRAQPTTTRTSVVVNNTPTPDPGWAPVRSERPDDVLAAAMSTPMYQSA